MTVLQYDTRTILELLARLDKGSSNDDRGSALEELIVYLFDGIPGVSTSARDVVNNKKSREIDIVFWNKRASGWLDFLDHTLFVECKNWSEPLGSKEVSRFKDSLKRSRQKYGILVAASGITGDSDDLSSAHDEIDRALEVEGIYILVITRAEIVSVRGPEDIVSMLQTKICQVACRGTSLPQGRGAPT